MDKRLTRYLGRSATIVLFATLSLVAGYDMYRHYGFGATLWTDTEGTPETYFDVFYPGFHATVQWVRDNCLDRIHSLPYDTEPEVHQRLIEMLYPIRLVMVEPEALTSGVVAILEEQVELDVPNEELFRAGLLKIVRVR